MDVCFECCVLRRADHLSRGILPTVLCRVRSRKTKPREWGGQDPLGGYRAKRGEKHIYRQCNCCLVLLFSGTYHLSTHSTYVKFVAHYVKQQYRRYIYNCQVTNYISYYCVRVFMIHAHKIWNPDASSSSRYFNQIEIYGVFTRSPRYFSFYKNITWLKLPVYFQRKAKP